MTDEQTVESDGGEKLSPETHKTRILMVSGKMAVQDYICSGKLIKSAGKNGEEKFLCTGCDLGKNE